jgi:hypothetical protein
MYVLLKEALVFELWEGIVWNAFFVGSRFFAASLVGGVGCCFI